MSQQFKDFLSIATPILLALIAFVQAYAYMKFRQEKTAEEIKAMKKTDSETAAELKTIVLNLNGVITQLAAMSKEQAVINVQVAKTLNSVVDKLDALTEKVNKNELEMAVIQARFAQIERDFTKT